MANEKSRGGLDLPGKKKKKRTLRTNHLLVIGIDKYKNGISELNNAVFDAKAFRDLLWGHYQFEKENTISLFDKEATKDNIMDAFEQLDSTLTKSDNLVIYFSGHGEMKKSTDRGYWLPVDARRGKWGSYFSNNEVIDYFKSFEAHHIFAVIDSCFSGALFNRNVSVQDEKQDRDPSRWLLTAGREELVSDGAKGSHSPFAHALLSYLENNDQDSFWVSELCLKVLKGVQFNASQSPRGEALPNVGHLGGQFVFYPKGFVPPDSPVPSKNTGGSKRGGSTATAPTPTPPPPAPEIKGHFANLPELQMEMKLSLADDIGEFFKQFNTVINPSSRKFNDSILQKGAYNRAKRDADSGVAAAEFTNRTYARIRHALTNLVDGLKESDIKDGVLS